MMQTLTIRIGQYPEVREVSYDLDVMFKILKALKDSFDRGYRHTLFPDWIADAYNFEGRVA